MLPFRRGCQEGKKTFVSLEVDILEGGILEVEILEGVILEVGIRTLHQIFFFAVRVNDAF
jgi:hypothetical protein